jgi:hypothetical protein
MNDRNLLGAWVRRFLLEYLVAERNQALARHHKTVQTQRYRLVYLSLVMPCESIARDSIRTSCRPS